LGSITTCFFVGFTSLFLNIFYVSLYLRQSIILCSMSPQIWQEYLTSLCTLICCIVNSETIRIRFYFILTL
jgi:hypothetical protein